MNVKAFALALMPVAATAQGYAGLGSDAGGFAAPEPGRPLTFPADHGPHPGFRIEWWYLTANLKDTGGRDWGLQWTLFRAALDPGDAARQVWMGHAALTTPDAHLTAERFAQVSGQAGVALPLDAWIDEWRLAGDPLGAMTVTAGGPDFAYDLRLTATGPLVRHGDDGYSVKSAEGQASYYYSQPFLQAAGTVETAAGKVQVTGTAWLDREWSSQPLAGDQQGWDWFALGFDSGERLMGFRLRGTSVFTAATWIAADGTAEPLPDSALVAEPGATAIVAGHTVPVRWRLRLPSHGLDVQLQPVRDDAWMPMLFPYWEGPVRIEGSHPGRGYLEMTGY